MNTQYKYSYNVKPETDRKLFKKICKTIVSNFKGIKKEKLLMDVDGTLIQIYYVEGKEIVVFNDNRINALYVDSDVDLEEVLGLKSIW